MTTIRKTIASALAVLTVAGALTATAGSAEAAPRHRNWNGGAVAAGVVGAIALGAIAASAAQARPAQPAYECGWERQPVYNQWGEFAGWRRVQVCD